MLDNDQLPPGHTGLPCNTSPSSSVLTSGLVPTICSHPVRGGTHAGPEDWVTASIDIQLARRELLEGWGGTEMNWSYLSPALSSLTALLPEPQSRHIPHQNVQ